MFCAFFFFFFLSIKRYKNFVCFYSRKKEKKLKKFHENFILIWKKFIEKRINFKIYAKKLKKKSLIIFNILLLIKMFEQIIY